MMIFNPRKAANVSEYDMAVAEWESNIAELESYDFDAQFTIFDVNKIDIYYQMLPPECPSMPELMSKTQRILIRLGHRWTFTSTD